MLVGKSGSRFYLRGFLLFLGVLYLLAGVVIRGTRGNG